MQGKHVIALLLVLVALVPSLAIAGSSRPSSTVVTIGKAAELKMVDADHSGKPSAGDYEIGKTTLVDPATDTTIGHSVVHCTILNSGGTEFLCSGYNQFRGGEVVLAGHFSVLSKTYRLAIVGGTGEYAGARGWETGTWLDAKFTKVRIVDTFTS
jgi:hypothetical protein